MSVIWARISGVLRSSCILSGGEINHEGHEGHGEFRGAGTLGGTRYPEPEANIASEAASFCNRCVLLLRMRFLLLASALVCASCGRAETQVADFATQRERMV